MIFASPAYQSGKLLVVITFDEASPTGDTRACEKTSQADCNSPTGPNITDPGFSPILALFGAEKDPGTTPYGIQKREISTSRAAMAALRAQISGSPSGLPKRVPTRRVVLPEERLTARGLRGHPRYRA
jgi:hypothetical protein